jgi:hypothetical protein
VGGYPRRPSGGPAAFIADEGAAKLELVGQWKADMVDVLVSALPACGEVGHTCKLPIR